MTLNDRARHRLEVERTRRNLSQRDLGQLLNWSQARVAQKFSGRTPLTLNELESLCDALDMPVLAAVRDAGLDFCAEMTPVELRALKTFRKLQPKQQEALLVLFNIKRASSKSMRPIGMRRARASTTTHGDDER